MDSMAGDGTRKALIRDHPMQHGTGSFPGRRSGAPGATDLSALPSGRCRPEHHRRRARLRA
jgi:hypothetical protein